MDLSGCYFFANIITRLKNNTYVSLESVEKICWVPDCKIDDIVKFISNDNFDK
ncbi:MAG: helix-turn-helix transcriptional regulator [Sporolactobacillus sp.]